MTLQELCQTQTKLSESDIQVLEEVAKQLPLMAEWTASDVFIDCMTGDGQAIVAAHARPVSAGSAYEKDVVGQYAQREKEPAVFRAMEIGMPVRDLKAVTQENRNVRQDVAPILNREGNCVGVLIREKDISGTLRQEKKFEQLARSYEEEDPSLRARSPENRDEVTMREVHHRVKNNLQLVASILNLQARRCSDPFTKKILQENMGRVLSIASIHDILTQSTVGSAQIESLVLLEQLRKNLQLLVPAGKRITLTIGGDNVALSSDQASAVSLVVNELITNALEHAFPEQEEGAIQVWCSAGQLFHTITVSDDGCGFDPSVPRAGSLGLNIVSATVRDRLRGKLRFHSDERGSRISFDFKTE